MATAEPGKPGSKDVEAEGDCGVAAPQQQTPHPFWEDSVFPDGLSPEKKACCRYRGLPVGHVGREPLLLAVVKGGWCTAAVANRRTCVRPTYDCAGMWWEAPALMQLVACMSAAQAGAC